MDLLTKLVKHSAMKREFQWNDLKVFLALYRARSIRQAAHALQVSHSTILRRIEALESDLDARLFDRTPDGFVLTSVGEHVLEHAKRVETEMLTMSRQVFGQNSALAGVVRITMPPPLTQHLLMPHLAEFQALYPLIELQIVSSYGYSNLSRRDADVAIRFSASPDDHLVGRRLPDFAYAVYATPDYIAAHAFEGADATARWLGWQGDGRHPEWRRNTPFPNCEAHLQVGDVLAQQAAARAGLGMAILPCWLADRDPYLQRVPPATVVQTRPGWVLTHPDLRTTERVRTTVRFIVDALQTHQDLISGTAVQGG